MKTKTKRANHPKALSKDPWYTTSQLDEMSREDLRKAYLNARAQLNHVFWRVEDLTVEQRLAYGHGYREGWDAGNADAKRQIKETLGVGA